MERIFFDSHMHTPLCKHAYGHPQEYVLQGWNSGLAGVVFTCHSPLPDGHSARVRMDPKQFDEYVALVDEGATFAPEGFDVRLGMESDFYPGMEPWLEDLHQKADFQYILGSVHWHLEEYMRDFWEGDIGDFRRQYFEHLAESAETGLFDSLAHPDLIKNADAGSWDFKEFQPDIEMALDRIAATGVAMELNTSGIHKAMPEMNPGIQFLRLMAERGIPVVIGSDSHVSHRVGEGFIFALNSIEAAGFKNVSVFEKRERIDIPIEDARASILTNELAPVEV